MTRECPFRAVVRRVFSCQDAFGLRYDSRDLPAREEKLDAQLVVGLAVDEAAPQQPPISVAVDVLGDRLAELAVGETCGVFHLLLLFWLRCCGVFQVLGLISPVIVTLLGCTVSGKLSVF